jgi:O-acetyl-ADP-ribose deacetylase (regulator of RNase III)
MAFPCISTGAYRFPFSMACRIALKTIDEILKTSSSIVKVFLVVSDERKFINYQKILHEFYK